MESFLGNKKDEYPEEIAAELKARLDEFAERGNRLEDEEKYEEAVRAWEEGLALIPQPQQCYGETIWFLAAIGDVYFKQRKFSQAHECFDKARGNLSGGGYGNPFIMLRLGECCLELGDERNAVEYLLRAYMMEGKEIFEPYENGEDDGLKYFDFLRTHVEHIE